ncbi:succinate-semialdehyde dehydrogenase I, partial [Salmonella enterica subsp. enterica serovar Enteritidis str. 13183-1]
MADFHRNLLKGRHTISTPAPPAIRTGGEAHKLGGNFFQPTILADVPDNAKSRQRRDIRAVSRLCSAFSDEDGC